MLYNEDYGASESISMFKRTWIAISCKVPLKSGFDHKLRDISFPGTIYLLLVNYF